MGNYGKGYRWGLGLTAAGLLTGLLLMGMAWGWAAPGSGEDPLLSRSYFTNYLQQAFAPAQSKLATVDSQLAAMEKAVGAVKEKLALPYADTKGHWALQDIIYLHNQNIITGYADGRFGPDDKLTREQLAIWIVRAKGLTLPPAGAETGFSDVPPTYPAASSILAAKEAGIIGGYPDGTFQPQKLITRAEMAVMLVRAFQLDGAVSGLPFKDMAAPEVAWAREYVTKVYAAGITAGMPGGIYAPQANTTRAEAVAFLARSVDPGRRLR